MTETEARDILHHLQEKQENLYWGCLGTAYVLLAAVVVSSHQYLGDGGATLLLILISLGCMFLLGPIQRKTKNQALKKFGKLYPKEKDVVLE